MSADTGGEQLRLVDRGPVRSVARAATGRPARSARRPAGPLATLDPVARVLVDVPLAHLDHPFDYAVTQAQSPAAVPGARVRVRFAGRLVDGWVLDRAPASAHAGRLSPLARVVSAEPVLDPAVARLARLVADRYAGTVADVLRLAVPPRHAAVEAAASAPRGTRPDRTDPARPDPTRPDPARPELGTWRLLDGGGGLLDALAAGRCPRAVAQLPPGGGAVVDGAVEGGSGWADALARAALSTAASRRGALVVVPDARDASRVDTALRQLGGDPADRVVLTADLGPAERYRRWLAVRRGAVRIVIGTRAAAFAPVADLGLVACWDDGDDLHAEPRAPYPHVREVLLLRAHDTGCAVLLAGYARTAEAQQLVDTGWAMSLEPPRASVRRLAPLVRVAGDDLEQGRDEAARAARLPSLAWRTARDALRSGPVLVQVPRRGYLPALACTQCREPARCAACHGPLALPERTGPPHCRWCGVAAEHWRCSTCAGSALRATTTGHRRTAEELARAFPGTPLRISGRDEVLGVVGAEPALVVATPGAEPVAERGYAAALLLDGHLLLQRASLRAGEEALRRWLGAAALVRPAVDGGSVVVVALGQQQGEQPAVQALVRWDPVGAAARELAERAQLGFPPVGRVAELDGADADVAALLGDLALPPGAVVLGPVPAPPPARVVPGDGASAEGRSRVLVAVPRRAGAALARALVAAQAARAEHRQGAHVRVRVDPADLA